MKIRILAIIGSVWFAACGGGKPESTSYTKSGNCGGASVATLRFAPEPTARFIPEAVWIEECPNGKFFMRVGDGAWKEIPKRQADTGALTLRNAGRTYVRVVD